MFRNDPAARTLVATDGDGEGVNLRKANLMVNCDLPWNPNRLEQRFGRVHRNTLRDEVIDEERLFAIKEEMEEAKPRKLRPFFILSSFARVFPGWAASCVPRKPVAHREADRAGVGPIRSAL
jgi:hypothetical protein